MTDTKIKKYIETEILPKYKDFDDAHGTEHVEKVIRNSYTIAKEYDVNENMLYVIAAYHDIGLINGRNDHEKSSAKYVLADMKLKQWFNESEISIIAEAVEDHRASVEYEPRSLYGKIISEADRDIEYKTIVKRTIQYSLKNFPSYTYDEHYKRTLEHIEEKYGYNGYIKLWLNTDLNQKGLYEIRNKIADKNQFKLDFALLYDNIITT